MSFATSGAGQAFNLTDWRQSVKARREIVRIIIVRAVVNGEQLEAVLNEFKRAVGWYRLDDRDRNSLYVMFHDVRSIAGNWRRLPQQDREAFIAGKVVPSTLAKQARSLTEL